MSPVEAFLAPESGGVYSGRGTMPKPYGWLVWALGGGLLSKEWETELWIRELTAIQLKKLKMPLGDTSKSA